MQVNLVAKRPSVKLNDIYEGLIVAAGGIYRSFNKLMDNNAVFHCCRTLLYYYSRRRSQHCRFWRFPLKRFVNLLILLLLVLYGGLANQLKGALVSSTLPPPIDLECVLYTDLEERNTKGRENKTKQINSILSIIPVFFRYLNNI